MKQNISDLLDGYLDTEVDLTGGEALSASRVKEITMKKIAKQTQSTPVPEGRHSAPSNKKRPPFRKLLLFAAAAAVLGCGAFAATSPVLAGDWFRDFFHLRDSSIPDVPVSDPSSDPIQAVQTLGNTFEGSISSNGATMTPVAALADENVYYLRLHLEAPEGTVLRDYGEDEGYYQFFGDSAATMMELVFPEDAYPSAGWSSEFTWLPDANPNDNQKDVVISLFASAGDDLKFNDGISKLLKIHGLWVQAPDKVYTSVFEGDFTLDIGQHFESQVVQFDCSGLSYTWDMEDGEISVHAVSKLETLSLSPLSLSGDYTVTGDYDQDRVHPGPGPLSVVMKDGSTAEIEGGGPSREGSFCVMFAAPLDLEQVAYVQYGEQQLPVSADKSE